MSLNKIAIVTGANKGLGYAIVKKLCFSYEGIVYLTSRDVKRGMGAVETLKRDGLNPVFHQLDVTDNRSLEEFREFIRENGQIDILINNAGILFLKDSTEPKVYQAEQTIAVNFTALVNFTEAMLPYIKDGGTIVNISSSSGHLSRIPSHELRKNISEESSVEGLEKLINNYLEAVRKNREVEEGWGDSPYVVSKVGVNAYTFMLHKRLSDRGIIVNCVHPGYVISDMTRGSGTVSGESAANLVLQIAQRRTGGLYVWSNGQEVPWNGNDPRGYVDGKKL